MSSRYFQLRRHGRRLPERVDDGPERVDDGPERVDDGPERVDDGLRRVDDGPERVDDGRRRLRPLLEMTINCGSQLNVIVIGWF